MACFAALPVVSEEMMSDVAKSAPEAVEVLEPQEGMAEVVSAEAVAATEDAVAAVDAATSAAVDEVAAADAVAEGAIEESAFGEEAADAVLESAAAAEEAIAEETVAEVAEAVAEATETVAEPAADAPAEIAVAEDASTEDASTDATDKSGKRVVRTLAVGQEVTGTVKRISEFGAFVDIGVGRDGLVHISELSVKRVGKVTDVIKEGDQIQIWIKKLDRERNRISLTLIPPGTVTIRDLNKDDIVNGVVTRILPYGAFVDIGVGRDALLHVREMGERYIAKPEEVVKVGEAIEARIIEIQRRRGRIDLSIKGLRPEPELEVAPVAEPQGDARGKTEAPPAEPEAEYVDPFADTEVLSPFQVALMRAQERSGVELDYEPAQNNKKGKNRKEKQRREQEDIYERTLKNR